jgi:hypothetical protein
MKESNMSTGNSPAFPCQDNKKQIWTGMNLRDYIAMESLHALIDSKWSEDPKVLAEQSYKVSDAMLEERAKYP